MAIVQISKIQQRSGNLVDLPQLDDAEFGWANDEKRLFIGKTNPPENIEVLTSYSNISFSQIDGASNANLNLSNTANGQILGIETIGSNAYIVNKGGNPDVANSPGGLVNLGNVSNVKMHGGAIGYVLETDGTGNLSWTSKGTILANIIALSNTTPIVMSVVNTTPYVNSTEITITGVNGVANANVNSVNFYVKLAVDYPTTGNVQLYTDSALLTPADGTSLTYTNSPNAIATTSLAGGGSGNVGGSNTAIQFNNNNILDGDADFTWNYTTNLLDVNGTANIIDVNANGNVRANLLFSNVATGTSPITVTSTTRVANLNVSYANVSDFEVVTTQTTGTFYPVFVNANTTANYALGSNASFRFNAATGNLIATLLTGILTTAAQPNITSVGSLTTLTVTGNANVGNLGTAGLVVATGNVTGGNLVTGGRVVATGNANVGNLGTAGLITATGNVTGGNLISSGILSVTGNSNVGNINVTGNIIPTANITYDLGNNTNRFRDIYLANSTIYIGNQTISGNSTSVAVSGTLVANISGNISTSLITLTNGAVIKDTAGNAVSFGENAGTTSQGQSAVAIGINAGSSNQGLSAIAVGNGAGSTTQGSSAISIGTDAGAITQGINGIALGEQAAFSDQQADAIAIGRNAGYINQGTAAIAIGVNAGQTFQANNSIILNATGSSLNQTVANTFNVAPVRNDVANVGQILFYNTASKEITYGNTISISGNATVLGIKTNNYYYANGDAVSFAGTYSNGNVANYLPTFTGTVGATALTTGANTTAGTITGNWTLTSGSRLQAAYADLAEYYEADRDYEPGTVLEFGGDKEVTLAQDGTTRVAGVVSTDPAYAMNATCQGIAVAIALQGRVPTKVRGTIRKGDMMVSAGNGFARPWNNPAMGTVIGKALENFDGIEGVIEIAVGRL
jgi:hypothetical protein